MCIYQNRKKSVHLFIQKKKTIDRGIGLPFSLHPTDLAKEIVGTDNSAENVVKTT
ncbi:hypothetical protein HanXRQr2_Chr04g0173661 [Helianthus annuus]|uniref:Uncharacterized protein n=1 Tax=Helianthus annuus TaxID=4232 RepID=A0A251UZW8_HELAN|nr:hypothetical protein HanXRQr2_Chr04g0173661 [Helianthus annuus]